MTVNNCEHESVHDVFYEPMVKAGASLAALVHALVVAASEHEEAVEVRGLVPEAGGEQRGVSGPGPGLDRRLRPVEGAQPRARVQAQVQEEDVAEPAFDNVQM